VQRLAAGWTAEGHSSSPGREYIFTLSIESSPVLGPTQASIRRVKCAVSSGVNRERREDDYSHSTIADVKNTWIYTPTPPYAFMAQ
jgi:hypothetical protein